MRALDDIEKTLLGRIEAKLMFDDLEHWDQCMQGMYRNCYVAMQ